METYEVFRIRDLCHQVDLLVDSDPGATKWELLDRARLAMNEFVQKEKWREAESMAYAIILVHSGQKDERYLSEESLG